MSHFPAEPKGLPEFKTLSQLREFVMEGRPVNPAYDYLFLREQESRLDHATRLLKEQKEKQFNVKRYEQKKSKDLVTTKAYRNALQGLKTEEILEKESITRRIGKKAGDMKMPPKIAGIVGTGIKLGTAYALMDDTDDNLLSTGMKIGGYTAAIGGAYATTRHYQKKDEGERDKRRRYWESIKRRYERQTEVMETDYRKAHQKLVEKGMDPDKATYHLHKKGVPNKHTRNLDLERIGGAKVTPEMVKEERVVRTAKGLMRTSKIGVGVIALGGILSAGHSVKQSMDAGQMVKKQERKQKNDDRKRREQLARYGYGNVDLGNIMFEMFEERTGHHKMGNSKF